MKISEIFYSIEGEGIAIGKPEVFVRLTGCNLNCNWCDTKYALTDGEEISIDEIMDEISKYRCKNVSITGGEPLLQREELLKLIKQLKISGYWIQINTNGTIFDEETFRLIDLITMDCKCPSSGMKSNQDYLKKTKDLFNSKSQFKFIISNEEDYDYAKNMTLSIFRNTLNIVFQPEWNSRKFAKKLAELVKRDIPNIRIILQQQKIIWGMRRKV